MRIGGELGVGIARAEARWISCVIFCVDLVRLFLDKYRGDLGDLGARKTGRGPWDALEVLRFEAPRLGLFRKPGSYPGH